ncbi:hypothetical protein [Halanaerobium congolense]|uniref:Aspartate/glutamate/uridylate kinase domain-containing protein n=1 Tax=Halanaerobium congolense TaxID=54121 RepID=A0A4R7EAN2_9FIRM|nr:hypothetical protein [Halanaerobium congolense]TDS32332.1 hypothetical protein BY453_1076 [Halanaerobium congolense]
MTDLTVLKIGGSFINKEKQKELKQIIKALKMVENHKFIIATGGGKAADLVRSYDSNFQLKASSSHFAAIAAMELNSYLISDYFDDFSFFSTDFNFKKKINIFLPLAYYKQFDPLPHSWDVSSDSIALELGQRLRVNNFCLIKQKIIAKDLKIKAETAVQAELLDNYFPILYQQSQPELKSLIIKTEAVKDFEFLLKNNQVDLLNKNFKLKKTNFNLLF